MWTKLHHAIFVGFAFTLLSQIGIRTVSLFADSEIASTAWTSPVVGFLTSACLYILLVRKRAVDDGVLWRSKHKVKMGSLEITLWVFTLVASGSVLVVAWWFLAS